MLTLSRGHMDTPSYTELLERVEELIQYIERDENRFYVAIDLAHQLRDELHNAIDYR